MRMMLSVAILAATVVVAACTGDGADPTSSAAPTTTAPTTTTTATPTTTTLPTTSTTAPVGLLADRFPNSFAPDWETWTVWVYAWPDTTGFEQDAQTAHDEMTAHAASLGYDPDRMGVFDLGCSPGTAEVLGLDPDQGYMAAALYFGSEVAAEAVAQAFEPYTIGYGYFYIGCAD
jgi:hypothetical protein